MTETELEVLQEIRDLMKIVASHYLNKLSSDDSLRVVPSIVKLEETRT
jgi:hypothetical protein